MSTDPNSVSAAKADLSRDRAGGGITVQDALAQIKDQLIPYLQTQGVRAVGKFKCFNPEHQDSTPSCHIMPGSSNREWKCFGCDTHGDIFDAAHLLEKMPAGQGSGADFWRTTVPELAKRFGVKYDPAVLTKDDADRYRLLSLFRDAEHCITQALDRGDSVIHQYLQERGWTVETARACGLGAVDSSADFLARLQKAGWTPEDLAAANFTDERIFSPRALIFTIRDIKGRPIAFAGRNMNPNRLSGESKYVNSHNSLIYQKGATLHMLDLALKEDGPLWIVEGYGDVVTLRQSGLRKVVALGGTAFTSAETTKVSGVNHLDILIREGVTDVVLALDGDDQGQKAIGKALDILQTAPTIRTRVCRVPEAMGDPDDVVRGPGLEALQKIPLQTPFAWQLDRISVIEENPREAVDRMLPTIAQEPSPTIRWEMCRDLGIKTGVDQAFIREAILEMTSGSSDEARRNALVVAKDLQRRIFTLSDPDAILTHMADAQEKISRLIEAKKTIKRSYTERLMSVRNQVLDADSEYRLRIGKFKMLDDCLRGFPTTGCMIVLGGAPNVGKTSWLRELSWEIARSNSNARVVFHSLDDPFDHVINGFVAMYTRINKDFFEDKRSLLPNKALKQSIWMAYDELNNMQDRLELFDLTNGSSLRAVERLIIESQTKYPGKKLIYILDSFNDLTEAVSCMGDEGAVAAVCTRIKALATKYNVPIVMNVQLRKGDQREIERPTLLDLKGTRAFEYHANMVVLMHQAMHSDPESKTKLIWLPREEGSRVEPINELLVKKNKISSFKGKIYMKFHTARSVMEEVTLEYMKPLLDAEEQRMRERWTYNKGSSGRRNYEHQRPAGRGENNGAPEAAEPSA